jgi:quinol monooxygenase YgiN
MDEIQSIARFKIHDGTLEDWKRLVAEAMETVRSKDSGTLQYDLFLSDDSSEGVVIERYRDSDAVLEYFANLGHTMNALLQTYSSISGGILGTPSAALREALEGADVRITFRTSRCSSLGGDGRLFRGGLETGAADQPQKVAVESWSISSRSAPASAVGGVRPYRWAAKLNRDGPLVATDVPGE